MKKVYVYHEYPFACDFIIDSFLSHCPEGDFRKLGALKSTVSLSVNFERVAIVFSENISELNFNNLSLLRKKFPDLKFIFVTSHDESVVQYFFELNPCDLVLCGRFSFKDILHQLIKHNVLEELTPLEVRLDRGAVRLSKRQNQLLHLMRQGYSNAELARSLKIKEQTVRVHLFRLYQKLNVNNRIQAINEAEKLGVIFD